MDNTNLKENLLAKFGGMENNDLLSILNDSPDDNEDNEPKILNTSSYIDMESISEFIKLNKDHFSIISVNIECINTKFEELLATLNFLKETMNLNFSVVYLQECWLQNDDEDHLSQFEIPGYRLLAQKQQCSKKEA